MTYLTRRNWPPGIVGHDGGRNAANSAASVAAPGEVIAGKLNIEHVFAGWDWGRDQRLGFRNVFGEGGVREASFNGLLDTEHEKDEEEGGKELEEGSSLVSP